MPIQFYPQLDSRDCGAACLRMVAKYYGKTYSLKLLRKKCSISRLGVSLQGVLEAAESIGFLCSGNRIGWAEIVSEVVLPCIIHWNQDHFVVVYKIVSRGADTYIYIADPAHGLLKYSKNEFLSAWINNDNKGGEQGVALLLQPGPNFSNIKGEEYANREFKFLFKYLQPHRRLMFKILLAMLLGSLLQLVAPFLTQAVVDKGISKNNLGIVSVILLAQMALMVSRASVDFFRNWILLHISAKINIALISDFLIKLMSLPISFFESKMLGDIMQRIGDHSRIEHFLTGSSVNILFSVFNLLIFSVVLAIYSFKILLVFLIGSIMYFVWVWLFMKKRRELDFKLFSQMAENQSNLFEMITGMQEIKLNNCEHSKRRKWERIQLSIFRVNIKSLSLNQWQQAGAMLINETKNIIVTFISASSVIHGDITLGMMMSIQYILGQLNAPIEQMISFLQAAQDAKISLERIDEIHLKEEEEVNSNIQINQLPLNRTIQIQNLSFHYEGPDSEFVLSNINLVIPEGKTSAIVGSSGSGKTTLLKLILGIYKPITGEIKINGVLLNDFNNSFWRSKCGAVLQDGFIFSDTISENIAPGIEKIDLLKLDYATKVANIYNFITSMPLGYRTKIGHEGSGISQGQRQRILIARAVYKNPDYIFFDEATNSLDANNEKIIIQNLNDFFRGSKVNQCQSFSHKTVIIVAHRLSTVKNAHQIVVLENGKVVEIGNHEYLTSLRGVYYNLVKNQLELGE